MSSPCRRILFDFILDHVFRSSFAELKVDFIYELGFNPYSSGLYEFQSMSPVHKKIICLTVTNCSLIISIFFQ